MSDPRENVKDLLCNKQALQKNRQLRLNIRSTDRRIHKLTNKVEALQDSIERLNYAVVLAKTRKSA